MDFPARIFETWFQLQHDARAATLSADAAQSKCNKAHIEVEKIQNEANKLQTELERVRARRDVAQARSGDSLLELQEKLDTVDRLRDQAPANLIRNKNCSLSLSLSLSLSPASLPPRTADSRFPATDGLSWCRFIDFLDRVYEFGSFGPYMYGRFRCRAPFLKHFNNWSRRRRDGCWICWSCLRGRRPCSEGLNGTRTKKTP